jgi:microcystin-dependent protein
MAEPFLGEIRMMGFNFAPRGWALCDGQILPINQNQSLYSLLGTTYGGDGRTSFALPDLRGRSPVSPGPSVQQGEVFGQETLSPADQALIADVSVDRGLATSTTSALAATGPGDLSPLAPYLAVNFCIALQGLFPSRN